MLLEIKVLTVHYDKVEALKGISLTVEEGTIVTLLGANGAGKTTTLRTISGLKSATRGEVWFAGQRIDRLSPQEIVKAGIAQVPEGRRIFPKMSVMENLLMGAYLCKDRNEIKTDLDEIFVHFPILKERIKQRAGSLSGGEQQMLATARALMSKPKLLLLDEPTLGLAPLMAQEVAGIVGSIGRKGFSAILVEQNARVALQIAHKGYVLETGRIVLGGTTSDLVTKSEYVKRAYLGT
jgi:branched-chain amino acid transport system ATP-binding protein